MAHSNVFVLLRKFLLLLVLLMVAAGTWLNRARTTSWEQPLWVTVYPISGDGSERSSAYLDQLTEDRFDPIEAFIAREAERFGITVEPPVRVYLGEPIAEPPPAPPRSTNPLRIGLWSLQLRWWAWRATSDQPGPPPDIRLFLVYYDPDIRPVLAHSLGLQKGMLGVVNIFSSRIEDPTNNFVIAHEMLHTLGASDKYAPPENLPLFPIGFAEPDRVPLYPQRYAEIMGGRVPESESRARIPEGLREALVGRETALEIRWIR